MEQLLPFILKSLLLAGAALGLLRLLRDRSAAARGVVAHVALLALVLMPVANLFLPPLRIAVPELAGPLAASPPLPSTAVSTAATPEAAGATGAQSILTAGDMAILAYALPAIILLFITLLATGRLFVLRAGARKLEDRVWLDALAHAERRMGISSSTLLLVSDDLRSPISWGLMRPVILLDRETLGLHDQAEAIVAHELAHIARFDWARLLFARVATALYWFNPLVWLLVREAHQLREEAADDLVLAAHVIDTDYAQLLLRTATHEHKGSLLTAHGVAPSRHSLTRRIRRVLNAHAARGPAAPGFIAGVTAGIIALTAPLAALSADARGAPSDNAEQPGFATVVVKTVSTATERSADMIHRAVDSSTAGPKPTTMAAEVVARADRATPPVSAPATPQPAVTWPPPQQFPDRSALRASEEEALMAMNCGMRVSSGTPCVSTSTVVCGSRGVVAQNTPQAAQVLGILARDGGPRAPEATYDLGNLYLTGQGVPQDGARAAALFREAAEAGYSPAMLGLAKMLESGQGVQRNKEESDSWFRRWARADDKLYTPEVRVSTLAERNIELSPAPETRVRGVAIRGVAPAPGR